MPPSHLLLLLTACNDYGFSRGTDAGPSFPERPEDEVVQDTGSPRDTGAPETETDDTPARDTGDTQPRDTEEVEEDTEAEDPCWEPEDGYAQNPAARVYSADGTATVTVTLVASDTSYDDELWIDSPDTTLLARAWSDPIGTRRTLGPYAEGTELVFAIQVQNTGHHWQSGPPTRNSDRVVHGAVTYEGDCAWLIGFEDLEGGGDEDYNDVVMRVEGMLIQSP